MRGRAPVDGTGWDISYPEVKTSMYRYGLDVSLILLN